MRPPKTRCRGRLVLLSYVFAIAVIAPTLAAAASGSEEQQRSLTQLTLQQLGNIEVTTVAKEPERLWSTSAAVFVITQEDIQRSGATSIPEVLRLAPGVEVARISADKWSIGIRGFGSRLSRDVLVLIDGRTVYTTLLAGTYWEVQNVMLQDVERIEVIRGPGATIWGPNAVNGVINIITKSTKDTHGALVALGGGNEEQGFLDARYGGTYGPTFDYRIYGLGFNRGPEFHTDGAEYDRWRAIQGGFRADWAKTQRDTFSFQGDIYDEGAGETVTATSYEPPFSRIARGTASLSGGNLLGRWRRDLGEGRDVQLQGYYDRTNRREPNFTDLRDTFDIDFLHRLRFPGRQQVSWGLGLRFSRGTNPTVVSGLFFLPETRTDQLYTGFVQDEIGLVRNRVSISLGTKLLKTNYTGLQLQPTVRLLWRVTEKQSLWTAFTHAVRTPSAAERAFYLTGFIGVAPGGVPFFARFNANPHFRSEQLNGYEGGYRVLLANSLYFTTSLFFNHYSGLFSEDLTGAPFLENNPPLTHLLLPAEFGNGLVGTTKGVELAPQWRPVSFWRLQASYSYLQMNIMKGRNSQDVGSASFVEGSSPKHQITAQSGLDFLKDFSFDFTYRYVSALKALKINSYSTADVRFDWRASKHLTLSAVGRNLFQPFHYEFASDPGPNVAIERSGYGQVTWTQ
jgi:iron complex outermembrane receptor protein